MFQNLSQMDSFNRLVYRLLGILLAFLQAYMYMYVKGYGNRFVCLCVLLKILVVQTLQGIKNNGRLFLKPFDCNYLVKLHVQYRILARESIQEGYFLAH